MKNICSVAGFCVLLLVAVAAWAEPPALPAGLGGGNASAETDMPSLPAGLEKNDTQPHLPQSLNVNELENGTRKKSADDGLTLPDGLTGFVEARAGVRLHGQDYQKKASLGEARLQLQYEKFWQDINMRITSDFVADPVADRWAPKLESGDGWIDLREAFISARATTFMDVKAGRQILTWGTGDMVFLNDLFPKDFDSFFIGRDEEYLKAPSDAIKTSFFMDIANLDVVYMPNLDTDRFADGARISTYDPFSGGQTSRRNILPVKPLSNWFSEDEWAARLYRNFGAYEVALYGYDGYWKNPQGMDMSAGLATFPRLSVYGASIRGPVLRGIGNLEMSYYDSRDDKKGNDPFIPNNQFRFLAGYEQEIASELTAGVQYNLERWMEYDNLKSTWPSSDFPDENRHLVTLRLTQMLMNQNMTLSLFNFWSPSERDGYLRPRVTYKMTDYWTAEVGGNVFYGHDRDTFFGQLKDNTNIYLSLRYSF